jgi:hypothetical protein
MFRQILIAAWALFLAGVFLLFAIRPKPGPWVPYTRAIRPVLFLLLLLSFGYAVTWVYREGMKRGRHR